MKRGDVWKVAVRTAAEADDAVVEWISGRFQAPATSYTDLETGLAESCVFLNTPPAGWRSLRKEISRQVRGLEACGLRVGPVEVTVQKLAASSWLTAWKRHFRAFEIGSALLIKPSWSKRRPRPGQATVTIDPGLSFGTGQHPTTAFCLRILASVRKGSGTRSFLDVGTGSGILAIAAAKLGYAPVHAFDFDPDSISVATKNAPRNRVADRMRLWRQDVARLPLRPSRRYDLVCANLLADLLLKHRDRLVASVAPGGGIVLAGILKEEFKGVESAYGQAGLRLVQTVAEGEWCSGFFQKA
jgi:ribosomal protein L11 methyltransferase